MNYIVLLICLFTCGCGVEIAYSVPTKFAYAIDNSGEKWTKSEIINGIEMVAGIDDFRHFPIEEYRYYRLPLELRELQIRFRIETTGDKLADAAVQGQWKRATPENKKKYESLLYDLKSWQKVKNKQPR